MITLFQIDKSGSDLFEDNYSISMVKNKEIIYGINIPKSVKDEIMHLFNNNGLGINTENQKKDKLRLKIRFHTAVIILLLEQAIKDEGFLEDVNIQICNDYDGHFHEIKDMIYKHLSKLIPSLKKEDIVQTRFQKSSFVDIAARNLRENNKSETSQYVIPKLDIKNLIKIIKK